MSVLTDEHVPSVFITTLRSNGHEVVEANDVFGEATDDEQLLRYCGDNDHVLLTHDKKDFSGELADAVAHGGLVVYTDANYLRDIRKTQYERSNASSLTIHPRSYGANSSGWTSGGRLRNH